MRKLLYLITLIPSLSFAETLTTVVNPFTGSMDYVTVLSSETLPGGSTQYIRNTDTLQTGATAYPQLLLTERIGISTVPVGTEKIHGIYVDGDIRERITLNGDSLTTTLQEFYLPVPPFGGSLTKRGSIVATNDYTNLSIKTRDASDAVVEQFDPAYGTHAFGRNIGASYIGHNAVKFLSSIGVSHFEVTGSTTIPNNANPNVSDVGYLYRVDASGGDSTVTLEQLSATTQAYGRIRRVCKSDSSAYTVTVDGGAHDTTLDYLNECVDYYARIDPSGTTGTWFPIGILKSTSTPSGGSTVSSFTVTVPISAASLAATITDGFSGGVQTGETTTNKFNYDFVSLAHDATGYFQFSYSLPEGWDGSTVTFQTVWTSTGGAVSSSTVFGLQALCVPNDGALDAAYGSEVTVADVLISTGDVHISPISGALTPGGTCGSAAYMVWRGRRDYANASDDLAQNVQLVEIRIRFDREGLSDE